MNDEALKGKYSSKSNHYNKMACSRPELCGAA